MLTTFPNPKLKPKSSKGRARKRILGGQKELPDPPVHIFGPIAAMACEVIELNQSIFSFARNNNISLGKIS